MLVGRDSERQAIGALMAGARVGDSRALVLVGEPGIGKTALLAEAETLATGMQVLSAQGVESEQLVPFAGLSQLLRPVLPLLAHIPRAQSRALGSALLVEGYEGAEPTRFAIGAATLSLLSRAAEERATAVLVDDAHLLDAPSAEALLFAARRLVTDPVAVLVAVRGGEPGTALWDPLPCIQLSGLSLEEARELVSRGAPVLGRPDGLARLHAATAGNPLALLELGDRLELIEAQPTQTAVPLSDQLCRAFLRRVELLPEATRAALLVAATDSTSAIEVRHACAALGIPEGALAEAEEAGLVTVANGVVRFHHPLVRSAVYTSAPARTRREVHRALAAVVPVDQADRLAWHLSGSAVAPDEATAATLERVAGRAAARGAHAIATAAYERAAALTGTAGRLPVRLAAAGEAAWLDGRTDGAMKLLDRALHAEPDARLRGHIQEVRGAVETRTGSLDAARTTLLEAAESVTASDADLAIRLYADVMHVAFYLGEPATATAACEVVEGLLERAEDPRTQQIASIACGMAAVLAGKGGAGIERIREATYALVAEDDPVDRFRLPLRVQGALWLREAGPHRDVVVEAVERQRERAALGSLPYLLMHIARDGSASDRWQDAEAAYKEAIRLAGETGQTTDLGVSLAGLAMLDARRGRADECRTGVAAAEPLCRTNHIRLGTFWLTFALGDLASGLGDPSEAACHYEQLESLLAATGFADPDQSCAPELVETYVHLGRHEDAGRLAASYSAAAKGKGQPWSMARAQRALALCADAPEAHFEAALELHAGTPDRYETARTELAYGAWLRRDRRRVDARDRLRSALATFEQLGAVPWADRAAQELQATGETARRRKANPMDELTPQERQIAQLLADGRTTREAAAALFLSPKTVEYHLRHVYMKLGIRSRAALAEAMRQAP